MVLDKQLEEFDYSDSQGATSCIVLITESKIYCANAGDSRAILVREKAGAIALSKDHKPNVAQELNRIEAAGHSVCMERVDGNLALSRALGDYSFKQNEGKKPEEQAVTAFPDLKEVDRSASDHMIVVACDGIWDCVTNEECADKLNKSLK